MVQLSARPYDLTCRRPCLIPSINRTRGASCQRQGIAFNKDNKSHHCRRSFHSLWASSGFQFIVWLLRNRVNQSVNQDNTIFILPEDISSLSTPLGFSHANSVFAVFTQISSTFLRCSCGSQSLALFPWPLPLPPSACFVFSPLGLSCTLLHWSA